MKIKHVDLEIPLEDPFKNCKLDRKQYAEILTEIVSAYRNGFTMAINNKWGTGKTTFVKMWKSHLENNEFKTIYFNAWESDIQNDALAAILAELEFLAPNKKQYKSLLKKGAILAKNILPELLKALASNYVKIEVIQDLVKNISQSTTEIFENEIEDYSKKKKGLTDFKKELSNYVEKIGSDKPLIFIIDELDRCRPNFAVEVLERIKHLFSVPGIIFVLSIDKTQLSNAVKGFYGSESLDAEEYLRRFIDLEYSIPEPDSKIFISYLYEYFGFDDYFDAQNRLTISEFQRDKESFINFARILALNNSFTLRQQEKILSITRLILHTFSYRNFVFPSVLLFLIYTKIFNERLYSLLRKKQLTAQQLIDEIEKELPKNRSRNDLGYFVFMQGNLLCLYQNYMGFDDMTQNLIVKENDSTEHLTVKSSNDPTLLHSIKSFQTNRYADTVKLDWFLNKIDLMEPFT